MPASAIDLVKKLVVQFNRFVASSTAFGSELQKEGLTFTVSLSYSQLKFSVYLDDLYFQYIHQDAEQHWYYHDASKIEQLKKHFESLEADSVGEAVPSAITFTEALANYLSIAESIASLAYLSAAGDDYHPGYFSEIIIEHDRVTLKQVNHMNSRSLDHKQNYSLRDLEFFIPLQPFATPGPLHMDEVYIGDMRIHFSDRSSANNRTCGDEIQRKIEHEKLNFKSI